MNTRAICLAFAALTSLVLGGCSYHARDADSYRKATRELLETKKPDIKSCYDAALKQQPKLSGSVVVRFKVEHETGVVKDARVDEAASTAPEQLGKCIIAALDGLKLDPPDARDGDATFTWTFTPRS